MLRRNARFTPSPLLEPCGGVASPGRVVRDGNRIGRRLTNRRQPTSFPGYGKYDGRMSIREYEMVSSGDLCGESINDIWPPHISETKDSIGGYEPPRDYPILTRNLTASMHISTISSWQSQNPQRRPNAMASRQIRIRSDRATTFLGTSLCDIC
jgi:hypothetical protein